MLRNIFTIGTVDDDPKAPSGGFCFINRINTAAAVVYKKVNRITSPIYISDDSRLLPKTEVLVPMA